MIPARASLASVERPRDGDVAPYEHLSAAERLEDAGPRRA